MNLRRGLLWALGGWGLGATRTWAQHVPQETLLQPFLGTTRAQKGRVKLELPRLADNGFSVPLKIANHRAIWNCWCELIEWNNWTGE